MWRMARTSRSDEEPDDEERWLCGDELRVSGEVVEDVLMDEGEAERGELRVGLRAVLRRRSEPVVLRRGVKDWKRLVRLGEEGIFAELFG